MRIRYKIVEPRCQKCNAIVNVGKVCYRCGSKRIR